METMQVIMMIRNVMLMGKIYGSPVVIFFIFDDGIGAVELLDQDQADKLVRESQFG